MKLEDLKEQISKEKLYDLYIIKNLRFNDVFKELNISRKDLRRLLTDYKISKNKQIVSNSKKEELNAFKNKIEYKHELCRSVSEQKLYDNLIKKYSDLQYDIRVDDRYPYYCDFYIKSLDLFIELQGHPSHGRLPIDMLSVEEYSKYPNKWVDIFARRDVEKKKIADKNNLNYLCIYPSATLEENYKLNYYKYIDIIDICYKSQK